MDFLFPTWGIVVMLASFVVACVVGSYDRRLQSSARVLVLCWAIFFTMVAITFAAGFSHHWIPQPPWMLLLFSLVMVFWTVGLMLTVAVRTFVGRIRGRS
jgi:uncharacterized transporter YbjL